MSKYLFKVYSMDIRKTPLDVIFLEILRDIEQFCDNDNEDI